MKGVWHLSIEIGPRCSLTAEHPKCPSHLRVVDRPLLSTERIAATIRTALLMGFEGYVGFHFYNEPTLYNERMAEVMNAVPNARYMLWTNGHNTDLHHRFAWVNTTDYPAADFDNRLDNYEGEGWDKPCWRPFIECAIDYSGRIALCCQDWRMEASVADIAHSEPATALDAWCKQAQRVSAGEIPDVCKTCKGGRGRDAYVGAMREVGM